VRAAKEVLGKVPRARFLIVGDGTQRERIARLINDLGLDGKVILAGYREDIPEVMAAIDFLVLASVRTEATSQVIPQAFAMGKPVVATRAGGVHEVVTPGRTGLLVPPGDADALARGMLRLLEDSGLALKMGEEGRRFARRELSIEKMVDETEAVYRGLLARRAPIRPKER
ncbi:MAG: glycosyltransferase, partial [Nitrospinota bacterium]